ncbi:MAG: CYTH and CHAD domain-containing protein [Actinomycetota bacterium]
MTQEPPIKQTLERELKLQAPPGFVLPLLNGEPFTPRRFTSTYYDTPELLLASQGVTLRRRVENRKGLWQLKLPRGAARLEMEEAGGAVQPPGSIMLLLTAPLRGGELSAVARIRTLRTGVVVKEGERNVAEVVFDAAQVLQGGRIANRFSEIEVELLEGDETDLQNLEAALRDAGAWVGEQRPKVFRALNLSPSRPAAERKPVSELAQLQASIAEQFRQIVNHDPGTRIGTEVEDLHQHRVAIRRLRSLLWAAGGLLEPEWREFLRGELEWIGDQMNPVRDLDVMIPYLSDEVAALPADEAAELKPFLTGLEEERSAGRAAMLEALQSERYLALLHTLEEATRSLRVRPQEATFREGAVKAFRRMRRAADALEGHVDDEGMHYVRRLAKKSRYSAEVVSKGGSKPVDRFLIGMKDLQEILGDLQDAAVAEGRILGYLATVESPKAAFALGRLAERQEFKKQRCRTQFPKAWDKSRRVGRKVWLC